MLFKLGLYAFNGGFDSLAGHNIVLSRIYENLVFNSENFCRYRIYIAYVLYFIAEEFNADREGFVRRMQLYHVAADPKRPSLKVDIVSAVLDIRQSPQQVVSVAMVAFSNGHNAGLIILGRTKPENARDRSNNNTIISRR